MVVSWLKRVGSGSAWWRRRRDVTRADSISRGTHVVIISDRGEYLVWPAGQSVPASWREIGASGTEADMRAYIQDLMTETSPAPLVVSREGKPWRGP